MCMVKADEVFSEKEVSSQDFNHDDQEALDERVVAEFFN